MFLILLLLHSGGTSYMYRASLTFFHAGPWPCQVDVVSVLPGMFCDCRLFRRLLVCKWTYVPSSMWSSFFPFLLVDQKAIQTL